MRSILFLALLAAIDFVDGACLLCEAGVDGLTRPNYFVDAYGTTCAKKMTTVAFSVDGSSPQCNLEISQYREMCCGLTEPSTIGQIATQHPGSLIAYTGPHPVCEICWDKTYPSQPAMVINLLHLGAASCRDYFAFGRKGQIVPNLCQALQYFSFEPCGCGVGDPIPQYGERTATTSYPTVAPNTFSPTTKVPTRSPSITPTTLNPTFDPTEGPSYNPSSASSSYPTVAPSTFSPTTEVPTITPSSIPTTLNPTSDPTDGPSSTPSSAPVPASNSPPDSPTFTPSYSPSTVLENVFHRMPNTDGKDGLGSMAGENRGGHGNNARLLRGAR